MFTYFHAAIATSQETHPNLPMATARAVEANMVTLGPVSYVVHAGHDSERKGVKRQEFISNLKYIPYANHGAGIYLPTKLGDFVRANVGKYSSTMVRIWV